VQIRKCLLIAPQHGTKGVIEAQHLQLLPGPLQFSFGRLQTIGNTPFITHHLTQPFCGLPQPLPQRRVDFRRLLDQCVLVQCLTPGLFRRL